MARNPHHENEVTRLDVTPAIFVIILIILGLCIWYILQFFVWPLIKSLISLICSVLLHPTSWFMVLAVLLFESPAPNGAGAFCLFIAALLFWWSKSRGPGRGKPCNV